MQAVHKQIAAEMEARLPEKEWLGGHMALPQEEIDAISDQYCEPKSRPGWINALPCRGCIFSNR